MSVAEDRHAEVLRRLDDLARGQARIEQRLRDTLRASLNLEDLMSQTAQDIATAISGATQNIRDTRQAMNTAFHTLLDRIGALAAQGDTSAIEAAVSGLRGEVDSLTTDVLANTPGEQTA